MTLHDSDLDGFVAQLRQRLEAGARQYGDSSFRRPLVELIDEVKQELLDTAGWSFLVWIRVERLRRRVETLDSKESPIG